MNKMILKGNLTKDMEVIQTKNGTIVGKFTVANNEKVGNEEVTSFINCVMFGENRVEALEEYLLKGAKVLVDGRLEVKTIKKDDLYNTYVTLYVDGLDILKFVEVEEEPKKIVKRGKNYKR